MNLDVLLQTSIFLNGLYFLLGSFILTIVQQLHFYYLQKIIGGKIWSLFFRFGVILHELGHLFFAKIFGFEVKNVKLFDERGGQVELSIPDDVDHLVYGQRSFGSRFLFFLINRLGSTFVGMGPLILGILLNYFLLRYLQIDYKIIFQGEIGWHIIIYVLFAVLLSPSFALSFQDWKVIFLYKSGNLFATILGSLLKIIFVFFVFIMFGFFFEYAKSFIIVSLSGIVILFVIEVLSNFFRKLIGI